MATKILLKKSVTGGASPLTSDLDQGELAINLVDQKIYTKDNGNNIVEISGAYVDAVAPANPVEGDVWYDTANNALKAYDGSAFQAAGYQTLGALEDVTLTSVTSGDHLTWNGSAFVNSNLESDVEGFLSVVTSGDGSLALSGGEFTYTGPSAAEHQAHFSAATTGTGHGDLSYSAGVFTYDKVTSAEVRADISVTDNGGDGSASYDNSTGVITYTGPSAAEARAHFSGGTGVTISSGQVSIGQDVGTTDDVVFGKVTTNSVEHTGTITLNPNSGGAANEGVVVISGDLTVNGTTTSVNSNEVNIGDSIILLNSDETGTPSQDGGIEIERGTSANVQFVWNESDTAWDLNNEELQNVTLDGGTY
jgi:hypothetical protein